MLARKQGANLATQVGRRIFEIGQKKKKKKEETCVLVIHPIVTNGMFY